MAGRPKRVFTDEQKAEITQMALDNCRDNTIAVALNIPINTLKRHFGKICTKKRQQFKANLRSYQNKMAQTQPAMAIFLGKNELDQTDKQVLVDEREEKRELSESQKAEAQRIANIRLHQDIA